MNAPVPPGDFRPVTAHAVYSMSSMFRWGGEEGCTASATAIAALERVVPSEDSEESAEGTAAHDEIERVLAPLQTGGEPLEIDWDQPAAFGISLFVSYAKKLRALYPNGQFWIEQHVRLTDDIWGRLDLGHWDPDSATVTIEDYKNGYLGVDAEENEQFRGYAAALIKQMNLRAKWVRYVCVQPNDFRPVPRVKQWIEPIADLLKFADRVSKIPDEPLSFRFGDHCRDCPLLGRCEPTKDILVMFGHAMATRAEDVQPAQIPLFLALKKPIDHFFEAMVKGKPLQRAIAGDVPPGMAVVTSIAHRQWQNEAAARAAIVAAKGIEALKLPTPAQAEAMGINVEELAKSPPGGPVLAFASDKRKPWAPRSSTDMFKGIPGLK